jgi:hypothetical protein
VVAFCFLVFTCLVPVGLAIVFLIFMVWYWVSFPPSLRRVDGMSDSLRAYLNTTASLMNDNEEGLLFPIFFLFFKGNECVIHAYSSRLCPVDFDWDNMLTASFKNVSPVDAQRDLDKCTTLMTFMAGMGLCW